MSSMLWWFIDDEDSRDLDQLTTAVRSPDGDVKVYVAIADVDAIVPARKLNDVAPNSSTFEFTGMAGYIFFASAFGNH